MRRSDNDTFKKKEEKTVCICGKVATKGKKKKAGAEKKGLTFTFLSVSLKNTNKKESSHAAAKPS